jgi:hypothetical protein
MPHTGDEMRDCAKEGGGKRGEIVKKRREGKGKKKKRKKKKKKYRQGNK